MVKMINTRATMFLSMHKSCKKWDDNLQKDFDHVLRWFDLASTTEREWFEKHDDNLQKEFDHVLHWFDLASTTEPEWFEKHTQYSTPARQAWQRIINAYKRC